ncbi:helix-turn-helix domain-containing protein [Haloferax sp. MBLA0076]|uniref:Helix-turn-helix domain-containing protein n=1 Tax=Haloferax litoreum TaxID=2666140 RepID=A0A6A8GL36_9EURY|nr:MULTISPECIES: helix-turn-helix domain-containing protein [Haloferax]KAB1190614.1 helix-turn-helix domain-containing protein [Haloferax sp. CBA1148]MRX23609.1 helix-turn-helix domain-containing protein [Haloferax litoreum]
MPRATLSLTLPEQIWVSDLSSRYPEAEFTVLAAMPAEETGVGLVEIHATDIEPIVTALDEYDTVVSVTILEARSDRALVQFETTEPLLILSLSEVGIPLELPITIVDSEVVVEVTAPRENLSELGEQLTQFGIPFDLLSIHQSIDTETLLTDDQYELVETAIERGYYDTPRTCTLTELAEAVGLAKSTTSEKLHRAEGKVMKEFLARDTVSVA